jgi:hypothetical protein
MGVAAFGLKATTTSTFTRSKNNAPTAYW